MNKLVFVLNVQILKQLYLILHFFLMDLFMMINLFDLLQKFHQEIFIDLVKIFIDHFKMN
jgi:hypothetical protein